MADDFSDDDLNGIDWNQIQGMGVQPDTANISISEEFEVDAESLEWADRIEEAFTQQTQGNNPHSITSDALPPPAALSPLPGDGIPATSQGKQDSPSSGKRSRTDTEPLPPAKRPALEPSPRKLSRDVLGSFDEHMTCPLCFDFLLSPHSTVPCGHTFCGFCLQQWLRKQNPKSCPTCRAALNKQSPTIVNFAMEHVVEAHVSALRRSGTEGWEEGGTDCLRREESKQEWARNKEPVTLHLSRPPRSSDAIQLMFGRIIESYNDDGGFWE